MQKIVKPKSILDKSECHWQLTANQLPRLDGLINDSSMAEQLNVCYRVEQEKLTRRLSLLISIQGSLAVYCVKCGDFFSHAFDINNNFEIIDDIEKPMEADSAYEQVLASNGELNLTEIVTDELLLSLPQRHINNCSDDIPWVTKDEAILDEAQTQKNSPFSGLKNLTQTN